MRRDERAHLQTLAGPDVAIVVAWAPPGARALWSECRGGGAGYHTAPDTELVECKTIMTTRRIRHIPVVADGELIGIVTSGDIMARESREREVTIDDIERFAELSGDTFYAHMDEASAKRNPLFGGRVAHGYFLVSAAAEVIAQKIVLAGSIRRQAHTRDFAGREIGANIHVGNFEAMDEIQQAREYGEAQRAEGEARGRVFGKAESLLAVLAARGLDVSPELRSPAGTSPRRKCAVWNQSRSPPDWQVPVQSRPTSPTGFRRS